MERGDLVISSKGLIIYTHFSYMSLPLSSITTTKTLTYFRSLVRNLGRLVTTNAREKNQT